MKKRSKTIIALLEEKAKLEEVLSNPQKINVKAFNKYQKLLLEIEALKAEISKDSERAKKVLRLQSKYIALIDNIDIDHDRVIYHKKMTAKMEGMIGVSTSCLHNTHCLNRLRNKIGVCAHCFASVTLNKYNMKNDDEIEAYSDVYINALHNFILLTSKVLSRDQFPTIQAEIFRLESLGDLENETHCINYFNLCVWNPDVKFTLWSKNPWIIQNVINQGHEKPSNLIIIYSNPFLDNEAYKDYKGCDHALITPEKIFNVYPFIDKVFSVFTAEYAIDNDIHVNCCDKQCKTCKHCYSNNNIKFINEILKSDQKSFLKKGGVVH